MAGYSGLDFSTVAQEIQYWLNNTASTFKGGFSGSGENGNDFSMPTGTPVYAVSSGTVVGAGYYGGGGVVSIMEYPGRVWYYQHLDLNQATVGQTVNEGDLIGFSGGQNSGGNHPSTTEFSTYPHIEVGLDAPWGGIWGGGASVGPNIDPRPALQQILANLTGNPVDTMSALAANPKMGGLALQGFDPTGILNGIWSWLQGKFTWLPNLGWDVLKVATGGILVTLCGAGLLINIAGPTIISAVGLSTGGGAGKVVAAASGLGKSASA